MRITDIKAFPLWVGVRNQLVVKVETDEGLYGLGESGLSGRELAVMGALRHYREWLIGRPAASLAETTPDRPDRPDTDRGASRGVGIRRDGTRFPQLVEATTIDVDGAARAILRVRDLTDEDRLQAELIQAQKMEATGQLVSGVAHELNNPLAAILGFSQLIRQDPSLPADLRANADLLVEEASRTRRIVQNLLDFARQRPPERYPTSIKALIDSVLTLQSYTIGRGQIELELDIPDDLPTVELDRGQMQQVLINLTHNAVYAIKHGGGSRIRISAAREGTDERARVRVTVMDDGPGVKPDDVGRLFDAFFTTKPPSDGTGLGLPVSHGIVRSHGGDLRYIPSAFGRGAAFTFDLPVHGVREVPDAVPARDPRPHPAAGGQATAGAPTAGGPSADAFTVAAASGADAGDASDADTDAAPERRPTILVVDDETSIRVFLGKALRALGYATVLTASGTEAQAAVAEGPVDAVLCDHQMPGMSGVATFDAIVAARPSLRRAFVLMSGDVQNADLAAFTASHEVGVLAKPFDLETLAHAVTAALAAAGPPTTGDARP